MLNLSADRQARFSILRMKKDFETNKDPDPDFVGTG
jgi:hypothetical protein